MPDVTTIMCAIVVVLLLCYLLAVVGSRRP